MEGVWDKFVSKLPDLAEFIASLVDGQPGLKVVNAAQHQIHRFLPQQMARAINVTTDKNGHTFHTSTHSPFSVDHVGIETSAWTHPPPPIIHLLYSTWLLFYYTTSIHLNIPQPSIIQWCWSTPSCPRTYMYMYCT